MTIESKKDTELDNQLASLHKDSSFEVIKTYKDNQQEKTQKVMLKNAQSELCGPFIRKEFCKTSGRGNIYKRLWEMQNNKSSEVFAKKIPKLIDYYEYGDLQVCILEFVKGETLENYIVNNDLILGDIVELFAKICEALNCLHNALEIPIIHRDIKPTNIIVSKVRGASADNGGNNKGSIRNVESPESCNNSKTEGSNYNVTLIDFGIARFSKSDAVHDTAQLGTPSFAPPEQYGFGQTCIESDIYALGMVAYFMLTKKISQSPLRENKCFKQEVSKYFQPVLLKATAFDPAARYHSAIEFLDDFQKAYYKAEGLRESEKPEGSRESEGFEGHGRSEGFEWSKEPEGSKGLKGSGKAAHSSGRNDSKSSTGNASVDEGKFASWIKLKHKYGFIWNGIVLTIWIWLISTCTFMIIAPDASHVNTTLQSRLLGYYGCSGLFISACAFLFLEKSQLKKKFRWISALSASKQIIIFCIATIAACMCAVFSGVV